MAGLEIDHVEAGGGGEPGGRDIGADEILDLGIGDDTGRIGRRAVAGIEEGMMKRDPRPARAGCRLREASGVGQLEGDDSIGVRAVGLTVGRSNGVDEESESPLPERRAEELPGIGTAIGDHGHRLSPPDELGSTDSEVAPATQQRVGGAPVCGCVPALHRMDAPPVADDASADCERHRHRRALLRRQDRVVEWQRRLKRRQMGPQCGGGSEAGNAGEHRGRRPASGNAGKKRRPDHDTPRAPDLPAPRARTGVP